MISYNSCKEFTIWVNGKEINVIHFNELQVSTIHTIEDNHGIKSFVIILNNNTTIEVTRFDNDESVRIVTSIYSDLIYML